MSNATTLEWSTVDKSAWPRGEWDDEPDKVQWVDEATNLDCLIVRGPHGALCGYVGISAGHPLHGVDYGTCSQSCSESWCEHSPGSALSVHGGVTFANGCCEPSREAFEKLLAADLTPKNAYPETIASQKRARALGFDGWRDEEMARRICHIPLVGRPDGVWWFGFDCSHYLDLSPRTDNGFGGTYRDIDYVKSECAQLARQLAEIKTLSPTPNEG